MRALFALLLLITVSVAQPAAPTITSPTDGTIISATKFNVTWNLVTGAGCYKIKQNGVVNGTTSNTYYELSDVQEDQHAFAVQSTSKSCSAIPLTWDGGTSSVAVYIDRTAPSVSTISPITATKGAQASFSVTATDSATYLNAGVKSCYFYWNGSNKGSMQQSGNSWLFSFTPPSAGMFSAYANCSDAAGLSASTPTQITVSEPAETVAPQVSITSPQAGAMINETVSITATATDNVGVSKVEFFAGSTLLGTAASAPYVYSWDTKTVSNGNYVLVAKAYDAAGNTNTSSVSVIVNNAQGGQQPPGGERERLVVLVDGLPALVLEEDNFTVIGRVMNQSGSVEDAVVTLPENCQQLPTQTSGFAYLCTAELGLTKVKVTAVVRGLTAVNTTSVIVQCRPKAVPPQKIVVPGNATVFVKCGETAVTDAQVEAVIGNVTLTFAHMGGGAYSAFIENMTPGTSAFSLTVRAQGTQTTTQANTVIEQAQPPSDFFGILQQKTGPVPNWVIVLLVVVGGMFLFLKVVRGVMTGVVAGKDERDYAAAKAVVLEEGNELEYLRLKERNLWLTASAYEFQKKRIEENVASKKEECKALLRKALGLEERTVRLVEKERRKIQEERKKDLKGKLVNVCVDRLKDGASLESIADEELTGWDERGITPDDAKEVLQQAIRRYKERG